MTKHKHATHLHGAEIDCSAQAQWCPVAGVQLHHTHATGQDWWGPAKFQPSTSSTRAKLKFIVNDECVVRAPVTVAFSSVIWLYCNHGLKYALFVYRVRKRVYCEKLMLIWILETRVQNQKSTLYCQLTKVKEIQSFMRKLIQILRSLLREHWTPTK